MQSQPNQQKSPQNPFQVIITPPCLTLLEPPKEIPTVPEPKIPEAVPPVTPIETSPKPEPEAEPEDFLKKLQQQIGIFKQELESNDSQTLPDTTPEVPRATSVSEPTNPKSPELAPVATAVSEPKQEPAPVPAPKPEEQPGLKASFLILRAHFVRLPAGRVMWLCGLWSSYPPLLFSRSGSNYLFSTNQSLITNCFTRSNPRYKCTHLTKKPE